MSALVSALFASTATAAGATGVTAAGVSSVSAGTLATIAAGEATTITATEAAAFAAGSSVLSTGVSFGALAATGFAAFSQVAAANARAAGLKAQARDEALAAGQEEIRGKQTANDVRERLIRVMAASNVLGAARGVDPFTGSAEVLARENRREGRRQIKAAETDAEALAFARRARGRALLREVGDVRRGGLLAGGASLGFGLLRQRGRR